MLFIKTCECCVHNCYDLPRLKRKLAFDTLWWSLSESFSMLWNYWLRKSAMFVCHQKGCLIWPGKFPFKKTKNTFFVCMHVPSKFSFCFMAIFFPLGVFISQNCRQSSSSQKRWCRRFLKNKKKGKIWKLIFFFAIF